MPCGARMEERGHKHSVSLSGERLCLESREYFGVEQMWSEVHLFSGGTSDLACDVIWELRRKLGLGYLHSFCISLRPIEQVVRTPLHAYTDSGAIKK